MTRALATGTPDFGAQARGPWQDAESWKVSSVWEDAAYYVRQVVAPQESIPPFKYRILPTFLVAGIRLCTHLSVEQAFLVLNAAVSVLTALLFEAYLTSCLGLGRQLAILGGCLFVASASNAGTAAFPMLEPTSCLFSMLIFFAVAKSNTRGFVLASVLGVATKEVLLFAGPLWWIGAPEPKQPLARRLLVASVPLLAFVALRLCLGGHALEVSYGFDLADGQLPVSYASRLLSVKKTLGMLLQVFLSFSFVWLGLLNVRRHPLLWRSLPVVPLVLAAAVLASSRLTRVLGVLFPIVISSFLFFFKASESAEPATSARSSRNRSRC